MLARERLRVLIVDDQASMRQLVIAGLRSLGIKETLNAEDGLQALAQLRSRSIDLVLLDAEMPRMSGLETLAAMREDPALKSIPVIMVTGRTDADFVQRAAKLGIDGYLAKPLTTASLGARIDAALRKIERGAPR